MKKNLGGKAIIFMDLKISTESGLIKLSLVNTDTFDFDTFSIKLLDWYLKQ